MNDAETILAKLKKAAEKTQKKYPQYKGHFDKYKLAVVKKNIFGKYRNLLFEKGETIIYDPEVERFKDMTGRKREMITAWCVRYADDLQIDVSIDLKDIDAV
jgi:hypothetical protein